MAYLILLPVFFFISIVYSTAGLGGGSAYIATMVLAGTPGSQIPIVALGCNIIVATHGFIRFRQAGYFRWGLFWPFVLTSIPFAYLGGRIVFPHHVFTVILAVCLVVASARLIFMSGVQEHKVHQKTSLRLTFFLLLIGSVLGLAAGITGIGGGIYLIPVLLMLGVSSPKEASAVASLFIVVNSLSGLAGHASKLAAFDWKVFLPLGGCVFIGGLIGSRLGADIIKGETLQKIVGVIILIAVGKLVIGL